MFKTLRLLIILISLNVTLAAADPKPDLRLAPLNSVQAVTSLSQADAERGYPVHIRAVCVVCFDGWSGFFANDGQSAMFFGTKNKTPLTEEIHAGSVLEIDGVTAPGLFAPYAAEVTWKVVGTQDLPPAPIVSFDRLLTSK